MELWKNVQLAFLLTSLLNPPLLKKPYGFVPPTCRIHINVITGKSKIKPPLQCELGGARAFFGCLWGILGFIFGVLGV